MNLKSLNGKTALVTGASSGLGVDFAKHLARAGCNLILAARREELLNNVKKEITSSFNVNVVIEIMDLSKEEAPKQLYEKIKSSGKSVDILINNAGFGLFGEFKDIPWEREEQMLKIDILTVTNMTKLFLKDMLKNNDGYILNISSIGAYQPSPLYASYSAAKSYVLFFTEALNYELRKTNVKVSAISPGITATEFLKVSGQKPTLYQRIVMMKSEDVTKIGLNTMLKGKPSKVPGKLNAFMVWSLRFVPRRLTAALAYILMKSEKRN